MLEEMMTGVVNGTQVSDGVLLAGGIMLQIPIAMVFLSRALRYNVNRWANILAGIATIAIVFINNMTPDLDDMLFGAVEVAALSLIIWYGWKWRSPEPHPNRANLEKYT
jgi:Sec-independent protein secretion pathway component TatC